MKRILRNNSIIIAAFCIMIVIVWYLNYAGGKDKEKTASTNGEGIETVTDNDDYSENGFNVDDLYTENNTSIKDILGENDSTKENEEAKGVEYENAEGYENLDFTEGEYEDEDVAADLSDEDLAKEGENVDTSADGQSEVSADKSLPVADSGEIVMDGESESSTPGEAVLATSTINSSFFSSAKLTREQNRAKEKESLLDMIDNEALSEEAKQTAIDSMLAINNIMEKENATEILLEAKGFEGAVVSIVDDVVDVVINAPTITEQQVAQIESIVKRKTGVEAESIVINPVVVSE